MIIKELKDRFIPLLFSISITWWVMGSFFSEQAMSSFLLALTLHSLVFIGFIHAGNSKLGLVLFLCGTILYFIITFFLIATAQNFSRISYTHWLASMDSYSTSALNTAYWPGTIFLLSYMFASIVFYFTCIRDRIGILFLTGFIPLIIHTAKTDKEISLPFTLFIITFFLLFIGKNTRLSTQSSGTGNSSKRWYLTAVCIFVFLVWGISMILPKPLTSPKLAEIDALVYNTIGPLLNAAQGGDILQRDLYSLQLKNDRTKLDNAHVETSDRILFMVQAEEPLYFRIQSRDKYERNSWVTGNMELAIGYSPETFHDRFLNLSLLTSIISAMDEADITRLGFTNAKEISGLPSIPQKNLFATVNTNEVQMDCFISLPGMYRVSPETENQDVWVNELGFCYPGGIAPLRFYERYRMEYVSSNISAASREMSLIAQMNRDIYEAIFKNKAILCTSYAKSGYLRYDEAEMKDIFDAADNEIRMAYENYTALPEGLPERIYRLADAITSNLSSDYHKASAIERFFHTSGFQYVTASPRLPSGKDVNDFFLFESKKGFCVHFASAMVILARACGLPARYTEGFAADEYDDSTGMYCIRANDAHAYPEVYIAGYGWMIFEPTVSLAAPKPSRIFLDNLAADIKAALNNIGLLIKSAPTPIKILFIPFTLLLMVTLYQALTIIRNHTWRKRIFKADTNEAVEKIFYRTVSLLKKVNLKMDRSDTPSMYAARALVAGGIDIHRLTDAFNRAKYGGCHLSGEELLAAYNVYEEIRKHCSYPLRGNRMRIDRR